MFVVNLCLWVTLYLFGFTHPYVRPLLDVDNVVLGDLLLVHAEGAPGGGGRRLLDERQAGR